MNCFGHSIIAAYHTKVLSGFFSCLWECYKDRSIAEERKKQKPMFTCGFSKVKTSRTCSRLNLADFGRSGKVMLRAVKVTFEAWQRRTRGFF